MTNLCKSLLWPSSKSRHTISMRVTPSFFQLSPTMRPISFVLLIPLLLLSACATPTVVQSVKVGDQGLTCPQLQNEFQDAEKFRADADKEKGMTGGNVARAILFWPAILGSFSNANEAIAAADARKVHLSNLMSQKNCPVPGMNAPTPTPAPSSNS